ncbi:CD81 antigen-like [Carcharodon carcharias]|uniref:CD81 antigen-like n=1 Tax=Carcharodon carcharias TaxID=13397 RepID=UPI001B7F4457|nr:CD81 antigen-like [Carcharodon carcharias]
MGVEGCMKCIKYLLFVFNFLFWLAGGVVLGVALWLRLDPKTTSVLETHFADQSAPSTFFIGVYILIGVGAVMMIVGFLGCYGAIQESQCMLGTFFACLIILFACEVAAGIWGFVNKDEVAKEMKAFYDQASTAYLTPLQNPEKKEQAKAVLIAMHRALDCCGSNFVTKFLANELCPKPTGVGLLTKVDCGTRINELFTEKLYIIGIAAVIVAVIMILEMIFSMVLCCGIRNASVY